MTPESAMRPTATVPPPADGGGHMPGLDGLRGVLVLGILTYHLGYTSGMFVTVDGFFALSGFLITGLLLQRTPRSVRQMGRWWGRRARRLIPAAALTVLVVLLVFSSTKGIVTDGIATMTWWANWHQIFDGASYWSPEPSPLRHTWTLSIEEQFYLLWPPFLAAIAMWCRRHGRRPHVAIAVIAGTLAVASYSWAAVLATTQDDLNRVYLGTDTRFGSIAAGCAAAAVLHGRPRIAAGRALTAVGAASVVLILALGLTLEITSPTSYRGGLALGGLAFVAVVIAASRPGPVGRALSFAPFQWLGTRSYGIYLWSWPAQLAIEDRWPDAPGALVAVATVGTSLLLGALSLRFVEMPLRDGTSWARPVALRRPLWGVGAIVIVVAMLAVDARAPLAPAHESVSEADSAAIAIAAARASQMTTTTTTSTTTTSPPTTAPTSSSAPTLPAPTTVAPPTTAPPPPPMRIMTAGDSQAYTAAHPPIPRRKLPPYIESVTVAGVLGCGILVRVPGWVMLAPQHQGRVDGDYCLDSAEVAEVEALKARPDWMVLFSGGPERPFAYEDPDGTVWPARHPVIRAAVVEHLTGRIERARAAGVRTALVEWACPGEESVGVQPIEATTWHNTILREVAATIPGTITIPPNESVCVGGDATAPATAQKSRAWGHEVHVHDQSWVWNVQLGPALQAAR